MEKQKLSHYRERLERLDEEIERDIQESVRASESVAPDNAIGRLTQMEAIQSQHLAVETQRRLRVRVRDEHMSAMPR